MRGTKWRSSFQEELDSNDKPHHRHNQSDVANGTDYSRETEYRRNECHYEKSYCAAEHGDLGSLEWQGRMYDSTGSGVLQQGLVSLQMV
jgi:hypothetical protein